VKKCVDINIGLCVQVCKHPFSFSPVYADDAPARLPFQELVLGMAVKAGRGTRYLVRLTFVLAVWLLFLPFTTFWIWRFTFVRSFVEAQRLFVSHCVPSLLLTDCFHGFLLSAGIVLIFLAVTSLREYFRHLREVGGGQNEEGVGAERGHGGRLGRRHGNVRGADGQQVDIQDPGPGPVDVAVVPPPWGLANGAGQLFRRNAENVAAQLERQAARLEAHVEQMFDAVEDADGAEDVPFDELVGMQGPVFHLMENAVTVGVLHSCSKIAAFLLSF
jgi:E3 ubiquitin-protein ligase MARCH6